MKKFVLLFLLCSSLFSQDIVSRRGAGGVPLVWDFNFEYADLTAFETASTWTHNGATVSISTAQSHGGTSSLLNNAADYSVVDIRKASLAYAEIYASFWVKIATMPAYGYVGLFTVYTVSGSEMNVAVNPTGTIRLSSAYADRGSTTAAIPTNTWTNIKLRFKFTTSATVCEVIIGAETKTDNTSITTSNINQIRIGTLDVGPNTPIYTDDVKISTVGYP